MCTLSHPFTSVYYLISAILALFNRSLRFVALRDSTLYGQRAQVECLYGDGMTVVSSDKGLKTRNPGTCLRSSPFQPHQHILMWSQRLRWERASSLYLFRNNRRSCILGEPFMSWNQRRPRLNQEARPQPANDPWQTLRRAEM